MEALSFSPLALFLGAGPVVRGVMIVLALASIRGWYLIVIGGLAQRRLKRQLLRDGPGLAAALGLSSPTSPAERRKLWRRGAGLALRRAQTGLTDLAIIAAITPFVGLFGTVWGIMTAFSGIAAAGDAGLAVVAPGIAEALAATAYGLAAAIPASIGYSRLGAGFAALGAELADHIDALCDEGGA